MQKDLTCPRKKFHDNLIGQLKEWHNKGDRLIVCLDVNENIYPKSIGRSLTDLDGLNMSKMVGDFTGRKIGPTFVQGSKPINRVWATKGILVTHPCVMPAGYGIGDHRMFVIDIQEASLVGTEPFRVQQYSARWLNTKVLSGATKKYVERLQENIS